MQGKGETIMDIDTEAGSNNDQLSGSANQAERATQAKTLEASREPLSVLTINGGSSSIKFALY